MPSQRRTRLTVVTPVACLVVLMVAACPRHAAAQEAEPTPKPPAFWTDPETGQVFTKPGPGRVPLTEKEENELKLEQQEGQILKLEEQINLLSSGKGIQYGPVNVKLGGFIEMAGIFRTKNEVADVGSDFNQGIPFESSPLAHEAETRFSARQSRISLLVTGDVNPQTHLGAYYEMDFLASGTTSNSRESFSYVPRIRQVYATLDSDNTFGAADWGFHLLAGQAWSLMTTNTLGILPRQVQVPLTIDAQYVVGFNWLRVPQFRLVEDFGHGVWVGLSAESPQTVTSPITAPSNVNWTNPGNSAGLLNSQTTYSNDYIPDFLGKIALDPGWSHWELKSVIRGFSAHTKDHGTHTTLGWGFGGAGTLPIVPNYVELQLSGLGGQGIGRYGSGQLPDAAFKKDNIHLTPVPVIQGLVGVITHPWTGNDFYFYGGMENAERAGTKAILVNSMTGAFVGASGYGSPNLDVSGCDTEGGTCQAQTQNLKEITGGFWQDIYKGDYGRLAFGFQGAWFWRTGFEGIGGTPRTGVGVFDIALRYYPFAL